MLIFNLIIIMLRLITFYLLQYSKELVNVPILIYTFYFILYSLIKYYANYFNLIVIINRSEPTNITIYNIFL